MLCPKCGHNNADQSTFCLQCGNKLNTEAEKSQNANPAAAPTTDDIFISADEHVVATIKNGMAINLLTGEGIKSEKAIVSNKRVYYRNMKVNVGKGSAANNSNAGDYVVNIKDVTGTRITSNNPWGLLVFAALLLIAAIAAKIYALILVTLIFAAMYFLSRRTLLEVQYAGGVIRFDLKGYSMKNVRAFRNAIYTVKDSIDAGK